MSAPDLIAGYTVCPRPVHDEPKLVRDEVAVHTGGLCVECFTPEFSERIGKIELVLQGARILVPRRAKPTRKRPHRPERNARKSLNAKARERAARRVAKLVPSLYDAILADERAKLGLDPWPVQIAVRSGSPDADLEVVESLL